MDSKSIRQALALLSVVHAVFDAMEVFGLNEELMPTVLYGKEVSLKAFDEYSDKFESRNLEVRASNGLWIVPRIHLIDSYLRDNNESVYTFIVLLNVADLIVNDLEERINDPAKLAVLEPVTEVVTTMNEVIDPEKDQFEAYVEAEKLLKRLYNHLEFS